MTAMERVKASLQFKEPERIPRDMWSLPYVHLLYKKELDRLKSRYPMDISSSQPSPGWDDKVVQATATAGN